MPCKGRTAKTKKSPLKFDFYSSHALKRVGVREHFSSLKREHARFYACTRNMMNEFSLLSTNEISSFFLPDTLLQQIPHTFNVTFSEPSREFWSWWWLLLLFLMICNWVLPDAVFPLIMKRFDELFVVLLIIVVPVGCCWFEIAAVVVTVVGDDVIVSNLFTFPNW